MLFIIIIIIAHMRVEIGGGRKEPGRLSMYCHNIIFKMSGYKDSLLNSDVNKLEELELGLNTFSADYRTILVMWKLADNVVPSLARLAR